MKSYALGVLCFILLFAMTNCSPNSYGVDGESGYNNVVTFDLQGGHINAYEANRTASVNYGCTVKPGDFPKNPSNGNAKFGGWFTEKNGIGNEFTKSTRVYVPLTVYANWIR